MTTLVDRPLDELVVPDPPADGPAAPETARELASPLLTGASAVLSSGAGAVLVGGLFTGAGATLLGLAAVALSGGLVTLSYRLSRPALLQWVLAPVLLLGASMSAAFDAASGSRNPLELVLAALRLGGIEQPPIPFDPGWRILVVLLFGGLAAAAAMIAISWNVPKFAVFAPVPLTFGVLLLQPPEGGELRTGAALGLVVLALVLVFGVDLGQQGEVSLGFQLRRIARGVVGLLVLLVALAGVTRLDFLFPPPKESQVVPPQKPQPPPPEKDRVLFTVKSDRVLPWRLGTLDGYDGTDWLTPPFDRSALLDIPGDGPIPQGPVPAVKGGSVTATYTVRGLHDRVIPGLAGATTVRRDTGFTLQVDPRTQVLRLKDALPHDGQTYTVTAAAPPDASALRAAAAPPASVREFTTVPPAPAEVQAILDKAPKAPLYDRLQFVRANYYKRVIASGPGKPTSVPPARVAEILRSRPASPYEITAAEALMARWAGAPTRFGYGYYDGEKKGGIREVRPRHGATWIEVYFTGHGWVPLLGTPPRAQGNLSSSKNPNPTVRPAEDLALVVYVPVQQSSIQLFYTLARYWAVRILPWVLGAALLLWAYPAAVKAGRRLRRSRWAARRGPRERIAVAYLELRDVATDLNIGSAYETPLEFLANVVPDEDHQELAWLVSRAIWGDLQRDLRESDVVAAEETAASLRRRMRGAQPSFNRVLGAVSRASLKNPVNDEIPNLWWPRRRRLRLRLPSLSLTRLRPATTGSLVSALIAVLTLTGCAQQLPLQTGDSSGMPDRIVPPVANGLRIVREKKAESAYVKAGQDALVEPGQVFTVHNGPNVEASVQVAPFKRALLDDGRQRELKDSVLASLGGGNLKLKRIGDVSYRALESPYRTLLLYLPPDTTYMMLVVARPSFTSAEKLLGALVDYQRGGTASQSDRVAELPDPLRGIDP